MRKPYTLYKRKTRKKNKYIYYIQFRDENGDRLPGKSSGQTSKTAAEYWAINQIKHGLVRTTKDLKFSVFAENWFIGGKCPYLKRQLSRGEDYFHRYAEDQRTLLINQILPTFANYKLSEITITQIENWLLSIKAKKSSSTANHALSVLNIMLREAHRRGIINRNPVELVQRVQEKTRKRGILTISEARSLFLPDSLEFVWDNNLFHYCFNLLACTSGVRLGEIQASLWVKFYTLS
jgi:hypothetical protein